MRLLNPVALASALILFANEAVAAATVVGLVGDGPQQRQAVPLDLIEAEMESLFGSEFEVALPREKRLHGGWTVPGIRDAILRQLADPEVGIIITTGIVASNEAARMEHLSKPVIAAVVADPQLQGFPVERRGDHLVSGKHNFVYLSRVRIGEISDSRQARTSLDEAVEIFHDAVPFEHLAVLVDRLTLESIAELEMRKAPDIAARLGVTISIVSVTDSAAAALESVPEAADAVLVSPLLRFDESEMRRLGRGLIGRQLPSFSLLGRAELDFGLLMASGGREEDSTRYARRVALNIQSVLLGDDPREMDVIFMEPQRLAINMETARAIGFSPRYAVLADAEQLHGEEEPGRPLSLIQAMNRALDANLALKALAVDPELAGEDLRLARSQLLPQLAIDGQAVRIDEDRANPLVQPERSVDATVSARQLVYSDDAWAALKIAAYLEAAAHDELRVGILDTLQATARAYLTALRAGALEDVQRANLEVTRRNLELARLRETIGMSGRGDVLRWISQLASDRQNLIAAEADRHVAVTDLNRILHRPQNEPFTPGGDDVTRSIALFDDDRFRAFIDNAAVWELFQDFTVEKALEQAPELGQLHRAILAQERQVLASRRKYFVPEVTLAGAHGTNISRGGAGSDLTGFGPDDQSWSIALTATWPLFTGGALGARLGRDRLALVQLERQRDSLEEQLEARTRAALHRAAGTYPAVELSTVAENAAGENLGLVTDAYRRGAVSVTDLIDAQNAALAAELRAADARYAYLVDVVDVLRSSGDFSLLMDRESTEAWFREVEAYIRERQEPPGL